MIVKRRTASGALFLGLLATVTDSQSPPFARTWGFVDLSPALAEKAAPLPNNRLLLFGNAGLFVFNGVGVLPVMDSGNPTNQLGGPPSPRDFQLIEERLASTPSVLAVTWAIPGGQFSAATGEQTFRFVESAPTAGGNPTGAWNLIATGLPPSAGAGLTLSVPREFFAIGADNSGNVFLHGGQSVANNNTNGGAITASGIVLNDTFLWNGTSWINVVPFTANTFLATVWQGSMVDDAGGGLLLFGRQPSGFPAQLFRLDPTMTWGPVTSSPLPISFFDFALVRDQRSDDIFVVDARNIGTTTPTTFSGRLNLSTTPPSILFTPQPNAFAPFSPPLFNPGNGTRGVMFAGQIVVVGNIVGTSSGRFLFRSAEGGVRTIGSGCPCNGGPGTLQAFASSGSVYPGSTITLAVSNFPGNALMALAASFSQANSTLAAPFFTPPCNQLGLFNPATVTGFTNGSGSIQFSLSIPNSVTMIGTGIFHQALSAQLGGSAPPSCTSNLTEIRVGLVPLPD